jgi:hypothetical protein
MAEKKSRLKLGHQIRVARNQAALQQSGLDSDVFVRLGQTAGERAHAGANFESCIPTTANEGFNAAFELWVSVRA